MEAEDRDLVETTLQVKDLAVDFGRLQWGFTMHVFKRGSGNPGKVLACVMPMYDTGLYGKECDYPTMLRRMADDLEELQKEAESW
jgi:hypothetical protein